GIRFLLGRGFRLNDWRRSGRGNRLRLNLSRNRFDQRIHGRGGRFNRRIGFGNREFFRGRLLSFRLRCLLLLLAPPAEQAFLFASVGLGLLVVVGTKHCRTISKVRHARAWPPGNGIGYPSTSSPGGVKPPGPPHRSPFKDSS